LGVVLHHASELADIKSCLASLQVWFCTNGTALNPDKSHAILVGTAQRAQFFTTPLMLLARPFYWPVSVTSSNLVLHKVDTGICLSVLNSCHSLVFITFEPSVTRVVCSDCSHSISLGLQSTRLRQLHLV